jgi:peptide/nickel transport system permease protein
MLPYVMRRFGEMVPLLVFLSIFMFIVLRVLPGDPLRGLIGDELNTIPEEDRAALMREFGLDKPLYMQYFSWAGALLTGDWGESFLRGQPVRDVIAAPVAVSAQLAALSWITAVLISLPIGVFSALKRNTWPDAAVNVAALVGVATPNFLQGLIVIIIFAVILRLLPTNGFVSITDDPVAALKYMVLPISTLATGTMASLVRQMRSAMLDVMNEDYIRTARAKGLTPGRVIMRHALKNALLPIVTIAGLQLGNLLSGTVIVETMFSIPGMGRLTVNAIYGQDYALVQAIVLILAVTGVVANLLADLMYVQLDPRIRI